MMGGSEVHVMFGSTGFPRILGLRLYGIGCVVVMLVVGASAVVADTLQVPSADYPTIQSAIDAAANGDTIKVAPGTYLENLVWQAKSIALIGAGADVTIVDGGGVGRCLTMTDVPDTASVEGFSFVRGSADYGGGLYLDNSSPTLTNNVVSGNAAAGRYPAGDGGGLYLYRSSPTLTNNIIAGNSGSVDGGGVGLYDSSASLISNTITGNSAMRGGGVYFEFSAPDLTRNIISDNSAADCGGGVGHSYFSSGTIRDNEITRNSAGDRGGGVWAAVGSPTVSGNSISDNSAGRGGGLYLQTSSATLTGNDISGNSASKGGGLALRQTGGTVAGNRIRGNTAAYSGGGMYITRCVSLAATGNTITANQAGTRGGGVSLYNASAALANNVITDNSAPEAAGVSLEHDSSPTLTNNTIASNTLGGCYHGESDPGTPLITNCILWGNGPYDLDGAPGTLTYSDIGIGFVAGPGNISADPMFVVGGDYHLQSGSPCIDAGDSSAPELPPTDKDGNARIGGGGVDMGAYEWQGPSAADDAYGVAEDGVLSVPAPGVLGNDADPNGDPLTALLVSDVSNGALTLNPNGSFVYTPNAGFNGSDGFSYRATDGIWYSNVGTATMYVSDPTAVLVTGARAVRRRNAVELGWDCGPLGSWVAAHVLRRSGPVGQMQRLTETPVMLEEGSNRYIDPAAPRGCSYHIELLDAPGERMLYGPLVPRQ